MTSEHPDRVVPQPDRLGDGAAAAPLAGLRIVEVSRYIAAPLAGLTLRQLGAEVIRVEDIGGGIDRGRLPLAESGTSLYWSGLNKGKQAIEVDLRSEEGRELVADLVVSGGEGGGILLTNTDTLPQLRYAELCKRRADVVHVQLQGKYDGSAAVDYTVQAETGFAMITGPEVFSGPVNHFVPAWDIACGLQLAAGLLAAERHRSRTGEGVQVQIALEDIALGAAGNLGYLGEAQLFSEPRRSIGNHVPGTFGRDFATSDGKYLMLVALTPRHWNNLIGLTGLSGVIRELEVALGVHFDEEGSRYEHRNMLSGLLEGWFSRHTHAEVVAALSETGVLWSTYQTFADLVAEDSAQLRAHPLFAEVDQPGIGVHLASGSPFVLGQQRWQPVPAPTVGQHTDDVLRRELGLGQDDLAALAARGVIGSSSTVEVPR